MIIVWHYRDLRMEDHPALSYAVSTKLPVLPLYIHDVAGDGPWAPGSAGKWWLHHSLQNLRERYLLAGSDLIIRKGNAKQVLAALLKEFPLKEACWIERYQPSRRQRDEAIRQWLDKHGCKVSVFQGNYLMDPDDVRTSKGKPYVVFTPFFRAVYATADWGGILLKPPDMQKGRLPSSESLDDLHLLTKKPWGKQIPCLWKPGRSGAEENLQYFCDHHLTSYESKRDFLAVNATSRLSPHLAFGELSPREVWERCSKLPYPEPFLRQLLWREFSNAFLYHFPSSTEHSWREEFEQYPWADNAKALAQWKQGKTGYPIVDAAMRQLWETGWMHNRARLIVGSFLVKDLFIHWIEGARWFWETLVDADLANNTLGWQWVAGSGPDAAPYFRIFNPILQGKKFDPEGSYVRTYVPELAKLPTRWIHTPWEAPASLLADAGIVLGKDYPLPMVDHGQARRKALKGYQNIKSAKKSAKF
ncbi:MAG: deoxyribodipyrimidine photo-lyase [Waddliaceae bacterium]